ncbi:hypothetical protein QQ045_014799 [Rhodiola kirilowii]
MSIPILSAVFFPHPTSIFITAMSFISVVSLANTGLSEIRGKHLQYSKFWNANVAKSSPLPGINLSGRAGTIWFLYHSPAFHVARNKRCGKRHRTTRELMIEKANRPKRLCGNCQELGHHNK